MNHLVRRISLAFARLIAGLGIFLLVPAWTLDFWQAWLYAFIVVMSAALITMYLWKRDLKLLKRRMHGVLGSEKEASQRRIQFLVLVICISVLVLSSLDHRFSWSHVPFQVVIVGDVLVALGFFIIFIVFKENTFAAAIIELATDHRVISTGPYAIVRHPMYTGDLILLFGTPLALGSMWALFLFVPITLVIVWRLVDEEKFLVQNLRGYSEYCRKVRYRLIPLLY